MPALKPYLVSARPSSVNLARGARQGNVALQVHGAVAKNRDANADAQMVVQGEAGRGLHVDGLQVNLRQRVAAGPVVLVAQLAAEGRVDGNAEAQAVVGRAEAGVGVEGRHDVVLQLALRVAALR